MKANLFRDQRLADIYAALGSPERSDLDPYFAIVGELNAQTNVDLVTMSGNVPEHLSDDESAVAPEACHRTLRPAGYIAFGNRDARRIGLG